MTYYVGDLLVLKNLEIDYNVKNSSPKYPGTNYNILAQGPNYTAIWADADASLHNGKFYVTSDAGFFIVDLSRNVVIDAVTQTIKGAANEVLLQDDIGDLNIGG